MIKIWRFEKFDRGTKLFKRLKIIFLPRASGISRGSRGVQPADDVWV